MSYGPHVEIPVLPNKNISPRHPGIATIGKLEYILQDFKVFGIHRPPKFNINHSLCHCSREVSTHVLPSVHLCSPARRRSQQCQPRHQQPHTTTTPLHAFFTKCKTRTNSAKPIQRIRIHQQSYSKGCHRTNRQPHCRKQHRTVGRLWKLNTNRTANRRRPHFTTFPRHKHQHRATNQHL